MHIIAICCLQLEYPSPSHLLAIMHVQKLDLVILFVPEAYPEVSISCSKPGYDMNTLSGTPESMKSHEAMRVKAKRFKVVTQPDQSIPSKPAFGILVAFHPASPYFLGKESERHPIPGKDGER